MRGYQVSCVEFDVFLDVTLELGTYLFSILDVCEASVQGVCIREGEEYFYLQGSSFIGIDIIW